MKRLGVAMLAWMLGMAACCCGEPPIIPQEKMKPGADFYFDLPDLGISSRLLTKKERKPVQMRVILPTNYRADKPHPVVVHEGGGSGWIDEIKHFKESLKNLNFILFSVDYKEEIGARDLKFAHALYGLDVIGKSTLIDRNAVFVSGISSGAYGITEFCNDKEAEKFCGFIIMLGGSIDPGAKFPSGRPFLHVAGEKDLDKASNGVERVVAQKKLHELLLKRGLDSEFLLIEGAAHVMKPTVYPAMNDWIYRKLPVPEMVRMNLYSRLAEKTSLDWRKKWYYQKLAESWLETPASAKARQMAK